MTGGEQCSVQIRYGTSAETAVRCSKTGPVHTQHEGMASNGITKITWFAGDRREHTGDWPGYCDRLPGVAFASGGCTLPAGHRGRCAP